MKNLIILVSVFLLVNLSQAQNKIKYKHILITNDDGLEDADRLIALAKSVKSVAERVSIVVSVFDRSGTSNRTKFGKHQSTLEVKCKYIDKENNISAYTIPGNPGDCVLIGLMGLFSEDKPDLVLSGINGGSNIAQDWFGSGTIGAIRMAAYLGVKGIALSGFEDSDERSFKVIPKWITKFISTDIIDEIDNNSYLTVGFPKIPLEDIKGVKISERVISFSENQSFSFKKIHGDNPHKPENKTVWAINVNNTSEYIARKDEKHLNAGYIVITPMTINENNNSLFGKLKKKNNLIPEFSIE